MPASIHTTAEGSAPSSRRRWPLLLIGAAAGTATWSGWVGLGQLTGFGVVHPLPGIWDGATLNTAITLPIGVEAYAVYALSVATDTRPLTTTGRRYAWASSAGALILGMAGQIAYHLMDAKAVGAAPWWIVAMVSCLPVLVLGAASLLWHLTAKDPEPEVTPTQTVPAPDNRVLVPAVLGPAPRVPAPGVLTPGVLGPAPVGPKHLTPGPEVTASIPTSAPAVVPKNGVAVPAPAPGRPVPPTPPSTASAADDTEIVAQIVASGTVPSIREIKATYRIGGTRAVRIRTAAQANLISAEPPGQQPQPVDNSTARTEPKQPNDSTTTEQNHQNSTTEDLFTRTAADQTQKSSTGIRTKDEEESHTGITDRVGQARSTQEWPTVEFPTSVAEFLPIPTTSGGTS
jgi:hypothetical protein